MPRAAVAAVIVAAAILVGVWMYIQSTPLETCVRGTMYSNQSDNRPLAEYYCTQGMR